MKLQYAATRRKRGEPVQSGYGQKVDPLKVYELEAAEKEILKKVQESCFQEELLFLQGATPGSASSSKKMTVKKSSHIYKLDPVLSSGLIRVGGRLQRSPISESAKHQVILPKQHHVSDLIIYRLSSTLWSFWTRTHAVNDKREILDHPSKNLSSPCLKWLFPLQESTSIHRTAEDG